MEEHVNLKKFELLQNFVHMLKRNSKRKDTGSVLNRKLYFNYSLSISSLKFKDETFISYQSQERINIKLHCLVRNSVEGKERTVLPTANLKLSGKFSDVKKKAGPPAE